MKKFLLLGTFCLSLLSFTNAQESVSFEPIFDVKDTVAKKKVHVTNETSKLSVASEVERPLASKKMLVQIYDDNGAAATSGPRLNPRAVSFVDDFILKNTKDLTNMKSWGRPYFNVIDAIFTSHKIPKEMKYLAVIESRLNTSALSWAGAVGPWQFMPETARILGLKVNKVVDERTNYIKSTHAAAKYLQDLYNQFEDWLLVIAAYNGGPGNVMKAIRKSGSKNFWDLQYYLPTESRNHVKKFIGTHYIFEGQGGLTTLTKKEADEYGSTLYAKSRRLTADELNDTKSQTISGKYYALVIAKNIMMEIADFNRYNPDFDKVMASANNTYEIKLPSIKMELFNANKYQILNESIQLILNGASSTTVDTPVSSTGNAVNKVFTK